MTKMNRNILFRGKRKDNGKWIVGQYVDSDKRKSPKTAYILPRLRSICFEDQTVSLGGFVAVIPETIGQYIGISDYCHREIFEDDIVNYHGQLHVIVYLERYTRFWPLPVHGIAALFDPEDSEVVGNIHDNPELIGGERKEEWY